MAPHQNTLHENFNVDYVITYRFSDTSKSRNHMARLFSYETDFYSKGGGLKKLSESCAGTG